MSQRLQISNEKISEVVRLQDLEEEDKRPEIPEAPDELFQFNKGRFRVPKSNYMNNLELNLFLSISLFPNGTIETPDSRFRQVVGGKIQS